MATLKEPFALDRSLNTTELTPRNIADVLAEGLSHITGRTASEVEYDNTDSGLTADNVQDALDEIVEAIPTVPSVDIQTAVDEFSTYNGGILDSLKVALELMQDLHGYAEPWVGGASKQLIPMTVNALKLANAWMTWNGKVATANGLTVTLLTDDAENVIGIDVDGTANTRLDFSLGWVYDDGSYVISGSTDGSLSKWAVWQRGHGSNESQMSLDGAGTFTDTSQTNKECVLTVFNGAIPNHQKFYPMLCLSSAPDPTVFAPYTNICPMTGHTQVEVEVGTNKLNPDNIVQGSLTTSALSTRCSTRGNLTIPISVGQTITVSKQLSTINFAVAVTDSSMSLLFDSGWQSGSSYTYVSAYDGYVELVFAKQDGTDITPSDVKSANFMVEFGSTPSPYVPYTKGTYSLTVNLGGTYYSGTLDVVSGVFTPDTAKLAINTSTIAAISKSGLTSADIFTLALPSTYKLSEKTILSHYGYENVQNVNEVGKAWLGTSNTQLRIGFSTYGTTTLEDFKTWLDANNVEGCFELANPAPIQLTPTMVKALVGENHLSAPLDGQEITESKYKQMFTFDDVIAYIQSL